MNESAKETIEHMPFAIVVYRVVGGTVTPVLVSDGAMKLFGYPDDRQGLMDFLYHDTYETVHPDDAPSASRGAFEFATGDEPYYENTYRMKLYGDERYRLLRVRSHWTTMDKMRVAVTLYEDISNMQSFDSSVNENELDHLDGTNYDHLTGLPNANYFINNAGIYAEGIQKENKTAVTLYLDILRMKEYNAIYGYEEGSILLRRVGIVLSSLLPEALIARFVDDHFVVLGEEAEIRESYAQIQEHVKRIALGGAVNCRMGVCRLGIDTDKISTSCDYARLACESWQNRMEEPPLVFYDSGMKRRSEIQNYVITNLDQAVEQGYIKVYYQPVIRTLTGALCGMEALARWDDPKYGLLSPAVFIGVLETSHQIHKLDSYMVREICRNLKEQESAGRTIVPISLNLSRLDFMYCDIFTIVEDAVRSADLPRDMLHIEITESVMINEEKVRREIHRFKEAGYQVWMDDFGSGYSSLNILKDFRFDEIKIDMEFLSSFSQTSQDIIESVVDMDKTIGMQSLAEGVETEEQYRFLKLLGCDKVQGYFFGKPMPYEECIRHCREKGLEMETRSLRSYYDKICQVNLISDAPVAVLERINGKFHVLQINKALMDVLQGIGVERDYNLSMAANSRSYSVSRRLQEFASELEEEDETKSLFFVAKNSYMKLNMRLIASQDNRQAYQASLYNLSGEEDRVRQQNMDRTSRNLLDLFDEIYQVDLNKGVINTVHLESRATNEGNSRNRESAITDYCQRYIYSEDQESFLDFCDLEKARTRLTQENTRQLSEYFRTKGCDGQYHWKIHTILRMRNAENGDALYTVSPGLIDTCRRQEQILKTMVEEVETAKNRLNDFGDGSLWRNFMRNTTGYYYWKDTDLRYKGVSNSFARILGIKPAEVIGKTDEDLEWNLLGDEVRNEDVEEILRGKEIMSRPVKGMIQGEIHNLLLDRIPVYHAGKIIGIIGFFIDVDRVYDDVGTQNDTYITDPVTGLMNHRGLVFNIMDYVDLATMRGTRFAVTLFSIPEFKRICVSYGARIGEILLKEIADRVKATLHGKELLARTAGGDFALLSTYSEKAEIQQKMELIQSTLAAIHEVQGKSCTIIARCDTIYSDDVKSPEQFFMMAMQKQAQWHH